MPKRTRAHILEKQSRNHLHKVFTDIGWVVEDIRQDYGEDLFVRIFDQGNATPLAFFVQAKATDNITKYMSADRSRLSFPIQTDHLIHWKDFWEPVFLTVWDAKTDITYWECIQSFLDKISHGSATLFSRKSLRVSIPIENQLTEVSLGRIHARTGARFRRFEAEREGAQQLLNRIKEKWGVEIQYGPQEGILMLPKGHFVHDEPGGWDIVFFGRLAALIRRIERLGVPQEKILDHALDAYRQVIDAFLAGHHLVVIDKEGIIRESYKTLDELQQQIERDQELKELEE